MKALLILSMSIAPLFLVQAQEFTAPKTGAAIKMQQTELQLKPGETYTTDVYLVRSRSFRNAKFGPVVANEPNGLSVNLTTIAEAPDTYRLAISADKDLTPGKRSMILKGSGRYANKVKGLLITIKIYESGSLADSP